MIDQNYTKKEAEDNTNKIKDKKYTEVSIRKNETQHRNEGSFEEFIESEEKKKKSKIQKTLIRI